MNFRQNARSIARHLGAMIPHYHSATDWRYQLLNQIQTHKIDLIIDIGANSGQFASDLRRSGFKGRIVSFEPLSTPFSILKKKAARDSLWDCHQCALGDFDGKISINVAGNSGESSSVLPMLKAHQDVCPVANYVGTEEVPIYRLDSIAQDILKPTESAFLKIDVQGFEKMVLSGGQATVQKHCAGMQIELSFLPLYEGGMLIREALDLVYSLGFALTGLAPCFTDMRNGRMLQADGIFFRQDTLEGQVDR
ncbi:MAG: FkbM family methyltransferase [Mycobacteriaceae bacterium]|nr:FkbM family methyltransferase [Mycobacteriaceae bacterium]